MIRLDKQSELDSSAGDTSPDAKRKKRTRKENRLRCTVFRGWLEVYSKDESGGHKTFWSHLEGTYDDFGTLVKLARAGGGKRNVRKAKKLHRHIALNTHTDKLPSFGNDEPIQKMMQDVIGQSEKMKECIIEPHTCSADEL